MRPRRRPGRGRLVVALALALIALGACSRQEVTVEQVERQVQLDPDGRVIDSSASSTTFVTGASTSVPITRPDPDKSITKNEATDGVAAIDCGNGAESVSLTDGAGSAGATPSTGDTTTKLDLQLVGAPLLDDLDGDGTDDLAAAYRCIEQDDQGDQGDQVALSFSLWRGGTGSPTRSAVATAPIDSDWTVALPEGPGDGRVGLSVLAPADTDVQVTTTALPEQTGGAAALPATPTSRGASAEAQPEALRLSPGLLPEGQKVIRRVLGMVDNGRLRLISDGPPSEAGGVDSLPITEFPEQLALSASGLGPLRLGATEAQLNEALALVVSEVEYPAAPACFGPAARVVKVGPIHLGLSQGVLGAVWVTDSALVTTDRTVALTLAPGDGRESDDQPSGIAPLTVGEGLDTVRPPQGLQVRRFGDGWAALSPTAAGNVTVAVESTSPGGTPNTVTGFGVAPSVCLANDFVTEASGT